MTSVAAAGTFTIAAQSDDPIEINRLGYGAMRLTGPGIWGNPADVDHARAVLRQVVEHGVNFIDTADSYGPHTNEDLIASTLRPYGSVVVATKAGLTRQGPDRWTAVGAPAYLEQCLEMSLRRLRVDSIDLWQLHRIDDKYSIAEQMEVFARAQAAGKIRHVGLSEVTVDQLVECRKHVEIATVQNLYNVGQRQSEPVLQYCAENGIGFIPWFPVDSGRLTGAESPLATIADRLGVSRAQVALAWLLAKSPVVIPIPGTANLAHLAENCASAELQLDATSLAELDAIAPPAN